MKGYPKSRFEIVNNTQIQSINVNYFESPTAVYMMPYTSDKGTEKWELLYGFDGFTDRKGGISFNKHGQAQLSVAQALRSGAYVFGKRMVSDNAALANTTVVARVVKDEDTSHVYLFTKSGLNCGTFDEACTAGYDDFDMFAEDITDIPLFTVAAMGRGESSIFFRLNPEYTSTRIRNSADCARYSFEVIENAEVIESIMVTLNPEIIMDGAAQAMNPKIKTSSNQVQVKLYEDGIYKLVGILSETANNKGTLIQPAELIFLDFINGYDKKGQASIAGISTINNNDVTEEDNAWVAAKPDDIETCISLDSAVGIPLSNGSYGTMTNSPMNVPEEYEKLLLGTLGKDTSSKLFDPVIYDLDAYKIDAIFDCNYTTSVKNAIIDLLDFRGDMVFLADLGTSANTMETIKAAMNNIHESKYTAVYHNYGKIIDPFTKKEITVTLPFLLIDKLAAHVNKGVGRPFAGIANNLTFPDIIENTINFLPAVIPGVDQKQELVDLNINYISFYDGVPVLETMYVNDPEYTQLSFLHNIMAVQEIIKVIRSRCPSSRYTFLDSEDLEDYIEDVNAIIREYATNFRSITCEYMRDERYESNNIFYAVLRVQFRNFVQEEFFRVIAISN